MTWYDVDDILYEGTEEQIKKLKCPDCGGNISYKYAENTATFEVRCEKCGYLSRSSGSPKPNCAEILGEKFVIK